MGIKKISGYIMAGGLISCLLNVPPVVAVSPPSIIVPDGEARAGQVKDGVLLMQGRIVIQESHVGFQVWSYVLKSGSQSNHYVLTGVQSGTNKLRVRLEQEAWHPAGASGQGIIINTSDDVAVFNVVADGNQTVIADRYPFDVSGVAIYGSLSGSAEPGIPTTCTAGLNFVFGQRVNHDLRVILPKFGNRLADNTLLAKGSVTLSDLSVQRIAVRFAPGSGQRDRDDKSRIISGENDETHSLRVKLQPSNVTTEFNDWFVGGVAQSAFNYAIAADGAQNVPTDAYRISIESALWNE